MKKLGKLLIVGAGLIAGWTGAAAAYNPVQNSGFETPDNNWRVGGTWTGFTDDDASKLMKFDPAVAHSGKQSLKLSDKWGDQAPYVVQFMTADPGQTYTLSVWAKAKTPTQASIAIQMFCGDKALGTNSKTIDVTTDWSIFTLTVPKLAAGTDRISLVLSPTAGGKEKQGYVWFDDIAVTARTATTQ